MEADAKHNDTDPCWGPLRRVDAYRIYLVSGLASAWPGCLGAFEPERRVYTAPRSGWLWGATVLGRKHTILLRTRPACAGDHASVTRGLHLAFGSCQLLALNSCKFSSRFEGRPEHSSLKECEN